MRAGFTGHGRQPGLSRNHSFNHIVTLKKVGESFCYSKLTCRSNLVFHNVPILQVLQPFKVAWITGELPSSTNELLIRDALKRVFMTWSKKKELPWHTPDF